MFVSKNPDQYYYKKHKRGVSYYKYTDGKRIPKKNIPFNTDLIMEYPEEIRAYLENKKLYPKLDGLEKRLKKILTDIKNIKDKISTNESVENYHNGMTIKKNINKKYDEEMNFWWNSFLHNKPPNNKDNNLLSYGIKSKKDFKLWLKNNHPDKGGDSDVCAEVLRIGRNMKW
jgi:TPR repeat protein